MGARLAALACLFAEAAAAVAADATGAALDVEVANRATVTGTIAPASELDVVRVALPAGATLTAEVAARGRGGTPNLRLFDGAGDELRFASSTPLPGGVRLVSLPVAADGTARAEVRGDGRGEGDFRLRLRWTVPSRVAVTGTADAMGLEVPFAAEAGTRVRFRAGRGGARGLALRVTAAGGFDEAFASPRGALRLPRTGAYALHATSPGAPVAVDGALSLRAPRTRTRLDVTDGSRLVAGNRFLLRLVDTQGGTVSVPALAEDQAVVADVSGAAVDLPAAALTIPSAVSVGTDRRIEVPDADVSQAGVAVRYEADEDEFAMPVVLTVPFDAAAFLSDFSELSVITRDDSGATSVVPGPYTVDVEAGTVSFPAAHFSSYAAAGPARVLREVGRGPVSESAAAAPDGRVFFADATRIVVVDPATRTVEPFAGGGAETADGTDRLAFAFRQITGMTTTPDGALVVADVARPSGDFLRAGAVFRIGADGAVRRIAGDGSLTVTLGVPALETGLVNPRRIGSDADGNLFLAVSEVFGVYEVRRIDAVTTVVTTVAGGGDVEDRPARPRDARLLSTSRGLAVDRRGRLLVSSGGNVLRLDLAADTAETLNRGAAFAFPENPESAEFGEGAPLGSVAFGLVESLAFDDRDDEVAYLVSAFGGVVWRLDLVRRRAFLAAGRFPTDKERGRFMTEVLAPLSVPLRPEAPPNSLLHSAVSVVQSGDRLWIGEGAASRITVLERR